MRYVHPARLTKKAVQMANDALLQLGAEAQRLGGFTSDAIDVDCRKSGGWVTFTNALGTIAQHKIAAKFLRENGAYFGFSYKMPGDPFTTTVLMYPVTTPDAEANKESELVKKLHAQRGTTDPNLFHYEDGRAVALCVDCHGIPNVEPYGCEKCDPRIPKNWDKVEA